MFNNFLNYLGKHPTYFFLKKCVQEIMQISVKRVSEPFVFSTHSVIIHYQLFTGVKSFYIGISGKSIT